MGSDENDTGLVGCVPSPGVVAVLIAIVTLAAFVRVVGAGFVMWDDNWCIYENPGLGRLTLGTLRDIVLDKTVSSSWYTPLTGLRWSLTYTLCGLNPLGYHLGNWLFHGINAVLVFAVTAALLAGSGSRKRITIAAGVNALLWSLHPLRVEPVAWAACAYGQATTFLLLSLLSYLKAVAPESPAARRHRYLTASVTLFAASLLSMPIGLGFIVVLIVLDAYPLGRLGGAVGWWRGPQARRVLAEKLPYVAVALVVVLITASLHFFSSRGGHGNVSLAEFGVLERAMQAMYVLAYYAWRPWYPLHLSPVYTTLVSFDPFAPPFVASAVAAVAVALVMWQLRRRWPVGLAAGICHLALLAPVLGLFEHPYYPSDRYSMLVAIVWSVLLAAGLVSIRDRRLFDVSVAGVLVVSVGLAAASVRQSAVWRDSVTLFEHMIRTLGDDPYRSDIHWRLGVAWAERGQPRLAMEEFHRTLAMRPDHAVARDCLRRLVVTQGDPGEIIGAYRRRLEAAPDDVLARYHLGLVLAEQGMAEEALGEFRRAAALQPSFLPVNRDIVEALNSLAIASTEAGRLDEAAGNLEAALAVMPHLADVHGNLAAVRALQGRGVEAAAHLRKAFDLARAQGNEEQAKKFARRLHESSPPQVRGEP
jgi:Flp pilus assembly protein TadD